MGRSTSPKTEKHTVIFPEEKTHYGLCAYCTAAPACSFLKASGPPVVQCEEFEALQGAEAAKNGMTVSSSPEDDFSPAEREDPVWERTGLCGNCENCGTCAFPREEGGVWRCEEYR